MTWLCGRLGSAGRLTGKTGVMDHPRQLQGPAPAKGLAQPLLIRQVQKALRPARQRLQDALEKLGEDDREVILLRHGEQLSNQEVAAVLGLTEPAASMRYLRAVRRLKAALTGDADPP